MIIIGCDFHTRFQQIAMLDPTTGEIVERRLEHATSEAEKFYASLPGPARVGVEATIRAQWFKRVLSRHGHELWIGDAAAIGAARVRKQKTDSRDALHILDLLLTNRFPQIWMPSQAERDLRHLLRHRHKLVGYRTSLAYFALKPRSRSPERNCDRYRLVANAVRLLIYTRRVVKPRGTECTEKDSSSAWWEPCSQSSSLAHQARIERLEIKRVLQWQAAIARASTALSIAIWTR